MNVAVETSNQEQQTKIGTSRDFSYHELRTAYPTAQYNFGTISLMLIGNKTTLSHTKVKETKNRNGKCK